MDENSIFRYVLWGLGNPMLDLVASSLSPSNSSDHVRVYPAGRSAKEDITQRSKTVTYKAVFILPLNIMLYLLALGLIKENKGESMIHFSTGTTMPRMMTFWQSTKMRNVGIAAIKSEAKMTPSPLRCCN